MPNSCIAPRACALGRAVYAPRVRSALLALTVAALITVAGCCATLDWDAVSPDGFRLLTSALTGQGSNEGTTTMAHAGT